MIPGDTITNQNTLDHLLSQLNTIIENQQIIKENQQIIKTNQEKLDAILANQNKIQANGLGAFAIHPRHCAARLWQRCSRDRR